MELKELAGKAMMAAWQDEIERAVNNVKRTELDKWLRRAWYRGERGKGRCRTRRPRRSGLRRGPRSAR